jgi:hypothetical protein
MDRRCRRSPHDKAAAAGLANLAPIDAGPAIFIQEDPGRTAVAKRAVAHNWEGARPGLQPGLRRLAHRALLEERMMWCVLDPDADSCIGDGHLAYRSVARTLDLQGGHPGRTDLAADEPQHGAVRGPYAMLRSAGDIDVEQVNRRGTTNVDGGEC